MFVKRFTRALAVTTAGTLIMASAAFAADAVNNDQDFATNGNQSTVAAGAQTRGVQFTASASLRLEYAGNQAHLTPGSTVILELDDSASSADVAATDLSFSIPATWANGSFVDATAPSTISYTPGATEAGGNHSLNVKWVCKSGCTESGGNSATLNTSQARVSVTYSLATLPSDTTAPVITPNISGTLGDNGWYTDNVTVTFSVVDNESAISSKSAACDAQNEVNADTVGVTFTCTATSTGGTSSESVTIKRDATAPTVSVTGFDDGDDVVLGNEPTAGCSRSDATSGLAATGNDGPTITADTRNANGVGSVTIECTARDLAGNTSSESKTYHVIFDWNGFFSPVENLDAWNSAKAGQSIPVKFSLGGDQGLNIFAAGFPQVTQIACPSNGTPTDPIEEYATSTANSKLNYDSLADQYNYVWKTEKGWGGKCFRLDVKLIDGTTHSAKFKFTK